MSERAQTPSTSDEWREVLEDEHHGQGMRALCRSICASNLILGGHWSRERLEYQLKQFVDAGDYGAAGVMLTQLCMLAEADASEGAG